MAPTPSRKVRSTVRTLVPPRRRRCEGAQRLSLEAPQRGRSLDRHRGFRARELARQPPSVAIATGTTFRAVIVSHSARVLFVHVQKTGGGTVQWVVLGRRAGGRGGAR